ncbi:unnamed protein product [Protopolystoma xenopodis]|uniref:PDZ domain-containing protein n=1 Tax=Protopolystoma xenopodis TaxID=117903 RepID=A0A3S4ZSI6_9PLAT|nr:unnamed protein product [Protopolystoma xenopodis]
MVLKTCGFEVGDQILAIDGVPLDQKSLNFVRADCQPSEAANLSLLDLARFCLHPLIRTNDPLSTCSTASRQGDYDQSASFSEDRARSSKLGRQAVFRVPELPSRSRTFSCTTNRTISASYITRVSESDETNRLAPLPFSRRICHSISPSGHRGYRYYSQHTRSPQERLFTDCVDIMVARRPGQNELIAQFMEELGRDAMLTTAVHSSPARQIRLNSTGAEVDKSGVYEERNVDTAAGKDLPEATKSLKVRSFTEWAHLSSAH